MGMVVGMVVVMVAMKFDRFKIMIRDLGDYDYDGGESRCCMCCSSDG
jgi:hypothetical protein